MTKTIIAAVSGGVDSIVMLDELKRTDHTIIVAHVNHGLRSEADEDEAFVRRVAQEYGYIFEARRLQLQGKSENEARQARWQVLRTLAKQYHGIIATAHHQDDILETMVINLTRGTGWRGIAALRLTTEITRPLLSLSKAEIVARAIDRGLTWREDESNFDVRYLRNYIRTAIIPRFSGEQRQAFLRLWRLQCVVISEVEGLSWPHKLRRHDIIMSQAPLATEIIRSWLASHGIMVGEAHRLALLMTHAKAARPQARLPLPHHRWLVVNQREVLIE